MNIDFSKMMEILVNNWPMFLHGIYMTILFAIVGTVCGFLIGLLVGGLRTIEVNEHDSFITKALKEILDLIIRFYIWIFRGTPMMIQAIFLYYLFKPIFNWSAQEAGLFIISVNTGAYMAEIIRSGIQSIDKGQTEAAKSIGMNHFKTMLYIVLPQAITNSFPSIGNQLIVNIKDSSMLNVLQVTELYFQTMSIAGSNMRFIETYLISAIIYLILTSIASFILNKIEKNMNNSNSHIDYCS